MQLIEFHHVGQWDTDDGLFGAITVSWKHRNGQPYCNLALSFSIYIFSPAYHTWWRHQMKTFSALLALCEGNSLVTSKFPLQMPVTRNFDVFFDLRLNKRLSRPSRGWGFETPSCSLWCHCIDLQNQTDLNNTTLSLQLYVCSPVCRQHNQRDLNKFS